jgi:hypothetical protein
MALKSFIDSRFASETISFCSRLASFESRLPLNLDLLLLITILILFNLPYLAADFLPEHDTRDLALGFYQFYNHVFWRGSIPRWFPADYGHSASWWQLSFFSPSQYFFGVIGLVLRVTDTMFIFKISCLSDQCVLLLGAYLLAKRLYSHRLTVFVVTLGVTCTTVWYSQIQWNLRIFYSLPLVIYFLMRFVGERRPAFFWLAGITLVVTSLGALAYWIPIWSLLLSLMVLTLIVQSRRLPLSSLIPSCFSGITFISVCILSVAFVICGVRSLHGLHNYSVGRSLDGMHTSRWTFLTYIPPMPDHLYCFFDVRRTDPEAIDITLCSGLIFIPAFFVALVRVRSAPYLAFLAGTLAAFLLAACGSFSWFAYWLPGMNMARHIGYTVVIGKIPMLFAAGFGLDLALRESESAVTIGRWFTLTNVIIVMALLWIVCDGVVGTALYDRADRDDSFGALFAAGQWTTLARMLVYSTLLIVPYGVFRLRPDSGEWLHRLIKVLLGCTVIADCALIQVKAYSLHSGGRYENSLVHEKPHYFSQRSYAFDENTVRKYLALMNGPGAKQSHTATVVGYDPPIPFSPLVRTPAGQLTAEPLRLDLIYDGVHRLIVERGGKPTLFPNPGFLPANDPALMRVLGVGSPKLRIVRAVVPAQSPGEIASLIASTQALDQTLILSGAAPDDIKSTPVADQTVNEADVHFTVSDFDYNHINLRADIGSNAPAWLVYADAYDPGWIATVNDRPAKVAMAYGAFKAVLLREPHNVVTFTFSDVPSAIASDVLLITAVGFVACAFAALGFQLSHRGRFVASASVLNL